MKNNRIFSLVIGLIFSVVYGLTAQLDIISAKDFMGLMKANPDLVIVDASRAKAYATNHVKGAIHINHLDLYQKGNEIDGLILPPDELAAFFGNKGISETSEIVIYDDGSQRYNTRIYWILKYMGAENVKMLHMDMAEWGKVRVPLTPTPAELKAKTFTPNINPEILVDIERVKTANGNSQIVLIDARAEGEYNGTAEDSKGHIPGAINIEFKQFLTDTGAFKPEEELRKMVADLGITPEQEIITYCKTSVRAAPVFVVFKNILGFENVKVYDGAYNEWIAGNPVVQ
jgi:thiosulfate/3-mercaptopyruvate sulfurtransferase